MLQRDLQLAKRDLQKRPSDTSLPSLEIFHFLEERSMLLHQNVVFFAPRERDFMGHVSQYES